MSDPAKVKYLTKGGGLPCGNWPKIELVKYIRADIADDMLEALEGLERAILQLMEDPSRADEMPVVIAARAAIAKAKGQ